MGTVPTSIAPHVFTSRWTDADRIGAIDRAEREGTSVVARDLGISPATLRGWRRRLGRSLGPDDLGRMAFAMRARNTRVADLRSQLRHDFLALAWAIAARALDDVHATRPKDLRDMIVAAATALDKFRLEIGESTGRTESISTNEARSRLAAFLGTDPDRVDAVITERMRDRTRALRPSIAASQPPTETEETETGAAVARGG